MIASELAASHGLEFVVDAGLSKPIFDVGLDVVFPLVAPTVVFVLEMGSQYGAKVYW